MEFETLAEKTEPANSLAHSNRALSGHCHDSQIDDDDERGA